MLCVTCIHVHTCACSWVQMSCAERVGALRGRNANFTVPWHPLFILAVGAQKWGGGGGVVIVIASVYGILVLF